MRVVFYAAVFGVAAITFAAQAPAAEQYTATPYTAAEILKQARHAGGDLQSGTYVRVERTHTGGVDRTSTTFMNGQDWRTTVVGGGYSSSYGDYHGQHWGEDDNGIVVLQSDFRKHVDPNALAWRHPEDPKYNVRLLGMTSSQPAEYVIEANPPGGSDEYRYFDAKTLLLDRVVRFAKDRYRHVTQYSDYRNVFGDTVAFRIQYSDGRPQNDEVTETLSFAHAPAQTPVTIPQSQSLFNLAGNAAVTLPASFTSGGIVLHTNVNGRGLDFLLDSGASGLLIDPGVAHQLGLTPFGRNSETIGGGDVDMGEVRIPEMTLGPLSMHNVAFTTSPMDQQVGDARVIGLMGFDFIASGILCVDFKQKTVTVYPRTTFNPTVMGLHGLPLQLDDGIPRVSASMEHVPGAFLVDTGAFAMLAYRHYVDKLPSTSIEAFHMRFGTVGGPMNARLLDVSDFLFGGIDFRWGQVIMPLSSTFDITDYDGIIGRNALSSYKLYFDYADRMLYVEPNP